ncbi:MAG: N-acetyl sugar amidotransferase [Bacteroidales bacterium]
MKEFNYKRCSKGMWDTTISDISFDNDGVSNYCKMQESLMNMYPLGEKGKRDWELLVNKIIKAGKGKRYDCIIGVSGGTDSSYLLHIAKQYGLNPLAVNLDNGWSSDISVKNIKKVTGKLGIDLETYVIDYDEVKIVLKSYILAGLPWVDSPTDIAIKATLYMIAAREGISYIMNGADFRSEGKQPLNWTYSDSRQMNFLVKKFFKKKLKTFPYLRLSGLLFYGLIKRIKNIRPLYFLPYNKTTARELLEKQYGWEYYGGHHHENVFTKFIITYWLPKKFNIDKRIITLSAQVLAGNLKREDALIQLSLPSYNQEQVGKDILYVTKKLDLSMQEFNNAIVNENHYFYDYPSYYRIIKKFNKIGKYLSLKIFDFKPGIFEAIDQSI